MLNERELAAVLTGLRLVQRQQDEASDVTLPPGLEDIFTNERTLEPLSPPEIDEPCERLNVRRTNRPAMPKVDWRKRGPRRGLRCPKCGGPAHRCKVPPSRRGERCWHCNDDQCGHGFWA